MTVGAPEERAAAASHPHSSQSCRAAVTVGSPISPVEAGSGRIRLADQRAERGAHAVRQRLEVVAALEHHQHPPLRHEALEPRRQVGEVGAGQLEPGERVVAMGVETGGDDQPVRGEALDHRHHDRVERGAERVARGAGRERQVEVRPDTVAGTGLAQQPGAGVERRLVGRHVEDARVVVEHVLGAVAVVHVPVDDRHALAAGGELGGADRGVVEEAETHRPVVDGVMAWRPAGGERGVALAVAQGGDRLQHRARAAARRRPRSGRHRRVRVELAAAGLAERLDRLDVDGVVDERQIVGARHLRHPPLRRLVEPGLGDAGERRVEAAAVVGMPRRRDVVVELGRREHDQRRVRRGHRSSLARSLAAW